MENEGERESVFETCLFRRTELGQGFGCQDNDKETQQQQVGHESRTEAESRLTHEKSERTTRTS